MKKVWIVLLVLSIPVIGMASPFMVCDPQAGVSHYKVTGPAWVPATVLPAQPDGSIKMDVAASTVGNNALTVAACIGDATQIWGELCSETVPFVFTRPGLPSTPMGMKLSR